VEPADDGGRGCCRQAGPGTGPEAEHLAAFCFQPERALQLVHALA
jgi:hypothetical protein